MTNLPTTMRAVQILDYEGKPGSFCVAELPVPRPGPGEVLVKVFASPVNPSDLMFVQGHYGFKKPLPAIPGFEGSGTVVAAGAGVMPRILNGKRVACAAADAKVVGGVWAEYLLTSAQMCIPLNKAVDMEQGAMMLVNPLTAWALIDEARRGGHRAAVQTAAASALGKMVVRLAKRFSLPLINIVRRPEQAEMLCQTGAEHVLDSSAAGFDEQLQSLCRKLGATIGFDAVAGAMSAQVMKAQPAGARLIVYGALSLEPCQSDPESLIFERKRLEGFWLSGWLRDKSLMQKFRVSSKVQGLLASDLKSEVQGRFALNDAAAALQQYAKSMTAGKVLIKPAQ